MNSEQWEQLEEADYLFRKMVRRFVKERDRISIEGITLPGMLILHKIIREGEQRLGDLAEQLDFTSGAITALSDKLESGGYTVRRRKEDDRRTVLLDITAKGRQLHDRYASIGERCITLLFEGFTAEELEQQSRFYERILANLEGFSDALLALAKERAEACAPSALEQKPRGNTSNSKYLSY
ncbi:MarR family winged helix-turn-helix transcriptional regulator [Paenibacillus tepidiphilus]|uniref:MarR family winged helix-turn-helix transcriptional regulator n=1 Tax=Paenibacillus tepidiphilus TaxID=2608683 RepID=UPI0012391ED6|nr:MarR family transcriptional regulator [Paenibacillus tepidiphilus]